MVSASFKKNAVSIILQITLIVSFISVFFFVYTSTVEHQIVVNQVNSLVTDFTQDLNLAMTPADKQTLQNAFKNITPPDMSSDDASAKATNNKLLHNTIVIISIVFGIGVATTLICAYIFKLSILQLLKESFFGLLAVAFVEFTFLTFFVKNYQSLDPNNVKYTILQTLEDYGNS